MPVNFYHARGVCQCPQTTPCDACGAGACIEEIIGNFGWCDRCMAASYEGYERAVAQAELNDYLDGQHQGQHGQQHIHSLNGNERRP